MNETMMREKIHQAVDNHCAHLRDDYWLAQRVIAMAQEQERNEQPERTPKRRSKLSVALIVAIVLTLMSVTAVAAVVLSARQVVEQEIVPMAHENDVQDDLGEVFTNAELQRIVEIARENGIELPQDLLDRAELGLDYWEYETIMIFTREAFGNAMDWTIEQQHWFGEVLVASGLLEENPNCLPGEGEIARDEALAVAIDYAKGYHDDLSDQSRWRYREQYARDMDEETRQLTAPVWHLTFDPLSVTDNGWRFTINAQGEIVGARIDLAPDDAKEMSGLDVYFQYERVYGGENEWTPEVWVALHDDLQGRFYGTTNTWLYAYLDFILPPEGGLTQAEAEELAKKVANRDRLSIYTAVCCMAMDTPVWKVEVRAHELDSPVASTVWWVEIDCMTGEIRDVIEMEDFLAPDRPPMMLRYMPRNVYEEWLTIENG